MTERLRLPVRKTSVALAILGLVPMLLPLQFAYNARREIGERDNWTCQWPGCTRSFQKGWHVQAAHYMDEHKPGTFDTDTTAGRILCTEHHLKEHIEAGDIRSARLLWEGQSVRTYSWIKQHGGHDQKHSFEHYVELYSPTHIFNP